MKNKSNFIDSSTKPVQQSNLPTGAEEMKTKTFRWKLFFFYFVDSKSALEFISLLCNGNKSWICKIHFFTLLMLNERDIFLELLLVLGKLWINNLRSTYENDLLIQNRFLSLRKARSQRRNCLKNWRFMFSTFLSSQRNEFARFTRLSVSRRNLIEFSIVKSDLQMPIYVEVEAWKGSLIYRVHETLFVNISIVF